MNEAPLKTALQQYVSLRSGKLVGVLAGMFFATELQEAHAQIGGIAGFRAIERDIAQRLEQQDLRVDDVIEFREGLVSFCDELVVRSTWLERSSFLAAIVLGLLCAGVAWTLWIKLVFMLCLLAGCLYLLYTAVRLNQLVAMYQRFIELLDGLARDKAQVVADAIEVG
jgi:hypothetical protein